MNGVLILLSVLAFSANSVMTRFFQTKAQGAKHSINLYQATFTLVAAISYFILAFTQGAKFSALLLLFAAMFGICFSFASLFSAKCMEMGYMSLSSVIINLSLILPVIFSWTIIGDEVEPIALVGLALIIVTLVLSSLSASGGEVGDMKKWLVFVLIAFAANGSSAIVQKQYKASYGEADLMLFMALAYLISSAIFLTTYLSRNTKSDVLVKEQIKDIKLFAVLALVSGLGSFAGNGLLGYLCDKVNGGVLYPCINGGLCIVVSIASFVLFKEKLSNKKIAAICTGVVAIVLLNL